MIMNTEIIKGLKILITGATGFKGSWLVRWLEIAGAEVRGFGLLPETEPNLFAELGHASSGKIKIKNILDKNYLNDAINGFRPELIFHLAAQPLVSVSYEEPSETFMTNMLGLVNLFEVLRMNDSVRAALIITSDKCYSTDEGKKKFKESDPLGGLDPYSASKACAEIIAKSYHHSFFRNKDIAIATLRAGNIIGGGDWSRDRLIPDIVRSVTSGLKVQLRNPDAVRPWQHVLDALYGYLTAAGMMLDRRLGGFESFNFGPSEKYEYNVKRIAEDFLSKFAIDESEIEVYSPEFHETEYLRLDSSKSEKVLGWKSAWNTKKSIEKTADWYNSFYNKKQSASDLCTLQINEYLNDINT